MKKQLEILKNEINNFKKDSNIRGVLLNGSVAQGTATETSDLDIVVLCDRDEFVNKIVDDILVEIHFYTYKTMIEKLEKNPMEVYRYIYSKVQYDDGQIHEIIEYARQLFENYSVSASVKKEISHWLSSTRIKLYGALERKDELKVSYLTANTTWKVLEGIWAVNNKPMPPSSLAFANYKKLENIPYENWFEKILSDDIMSRGYSMYKIITWIIERL